MTEVQDTLRGAKEVLLNEGWAKGRLVTLSVAGPRFCVSGAIARALDLFGENWIVKEGPRASGIWNEVITELALTLEARGPRVRVVSWNDANDRTVDDVIELIDETLARLAPQAATQEKEIVGV